jgi:glucose/arabinose dehydrogenase
LIRTIVEGLDLPTSFVFAPDGSAFIAEKSGTVKKMTDGALRDNPVVTLANVNDYGDRGLLSIALDPSYPTKRYLYLLYTYENDPTNVAGPKTAQLIRLTLDANDVAIPGSKLVLLGAVVGDAAHPFCESYAAGADCISSDSSSHSIADLKFGPDKSLYVSIGDGANFDNVDPLAHRAQDLTRLNGKVLRIDPATGKGYRNNPYYKTNLKINRSKVWNLGLRNPFRMTFRASDGKLFIGDVGWNDFEEVNIGAKGSNFGWPCREGYGPTPGYPAPGKKCPATAYADPIFAYGHDELTGGAIVGGLFYGGTSYPSEYAGTYFYGDFTQNFIKRLAIDANGTVTGEEDFITDAGGPVAFGEDASHDVYYLSIYTGELRRIEYVGIDNRPPVPALSVTPTSGPVPLDVSFDASASIDPDGDPMTFLWDFGDGTQSTLESPVHRYDTSIDTAVTLTVFDDRGGSASRSVRIDAGNSAPAAAIESPLDGTTYRANQVVALSGLGYDQEDGDLPESAYAWKLVLHHNAHVHILDQLTGSHPSFVAPDHGPDPDVYLEVALTVTDKEGLIGTSSISMHLASSTSACSQDLAHPVLTSDISSKTHTGAKAVPTYVSPEWTAWIPGASWIWNSYFVNDPANGETETFTRTFDLSGTPTAGGIVIGADDFYEASLNGVDFATVSDLNNFAEGNQDTYDVAGLLRRGENTLTITVHNIPTGDVDPKANGAGLRYRLTMTNDSCQN